MAEMNFVSGEFRTFRASITFHVGKLQRYVDKGVEVQYDGLIFKFGNEEHSMPEIRSAIKAGLLVPLDSSVSDHVPASAGIRVRPTTLPATETAPARAELAPPVHGEQTEVGRVKADGVVAESPKKFNPTLVRDTGPEDRTVADFKASKAAAVKPAAPAEDPARASLDGAKVVAGGFRTATTTSLTLNGSTTQAQVPEGARARPVSEEPGAELGGSRVVGKAVAAPVPKKVTVDSEEAARKVASQIERPRVKAPERPSILSPAQSEDVAAAAADDVGEIISVLDPQERAAAVAAERKRQAERAEAEAAVAESPAASPAAAEVPASSPGTGTEAPPAPPAAGDGGEIAPGVVWDRTAHWSTRVKRALGYADQPAVVEAICQAETESVAKLIRKGLTPKTVP